MSSAKVYCDDCEIWYDVEFINISDLPDMKCPKCKSDKIYFGDITQDDIEDCDKDVVLGRGGCGQK